MQIKKLIFIVTISLQSLINGAATQDIPTTTQKDETLKELDATDLTGIKIAHTKLDKLASKYETSLSESEKRIVAEYIVACIKFLDIASAFEKLNNTINDAEIKQSSENLILLHRLKETLINLYKAQSNEISAVSYLNLKLTHHNINNMIEETLKINDHPEIYRQLLEEFYVKIYNSIKDDKYKNIVYLTMDNGLLPNPEEIRNPLYKLPDPKEAELLFQQKLEEIQKKLNDLAIFYKLNLDDVDYQITIEYIYYYIKCIDLGISYNTLNNQLKRLNKIDPTNENFIGLKTFENGLKHVCKKYVKTLQAIGKYKNDSIKNVIGNIVNIKNFPDLFFPEVRNVLAKFYINLYDGLDQTSTKTILHGKDYKQSLPSTTDILTTLYPLPDFKFL